jgi:hypothetical protein
MKAFLIGLTLAGAAGCVSARPVRLVPVADGTPMDCGNMIQATALEHAIVHVAPDRNSESVATLGAYTPVCVGRRGRGFGLLAVRLADGTRGFMDTDSLSGLVVDSPPVLPYGFE